VWFKPLPAGDAATNFHPQKYEGKTVLTWWQGRILGIGFGHGRDEIYSTSYRPIGAVHAGNGYDADLHEFRLTPEGTAWIDAFDPVAVDLASMGGARRGVVTDCVIQEIDVETGLVMWEWHALGHIPLRDAYSHMPHTGSYYWDYVHINSIDPRRPGRLLVSSRNTWTVFDVDLHTGGIIWRLGGKHSTFKRGPGTHFYWQHDASWQPGGLISVFDNGSYPPEEKQSRGPILDPDTHTKKVSLVQAFVNPNQTRLADSQGSLLRLADGNWLMGYGGLAYFTEYSNSGRVLFDASLGLNVQSFRTYAARWSGRPRTRPAIAAQTTRSAGGMIVEASWNGATTVRAWRVLAGSSPTSLRAITTAPRRGFETTIPIRTSARYVAVAALGASGRTLATSTTTTPSS
jgi:hypothetical protein